MTYEDFLLLKETLNAMDWDLETGGPEEEGYEIDGWWFESCN